jgi:DNA modification methylase/intein/homing endonuclease
MIINANALAIPLEDETVQTTVTSPPYYGLRNYGTAKWIGGLETCDHAAAKIKSRYDYAMQEGSRHADIAASTQGTDGGKYKMVCPTCGAQKIDDQIGLEESPEEYVQKLVAVFREVWRVTKADGTLWLNLGDSYWGGKGQSSQAWSTEHQDRDTLEKSQHQITGKGQTRPTDGKHPTIKPKDLIGIPWMVAFALRADGWYLRRDIIWCLSGGAYVYAKTQKGVGVMMIRELIRLPENTVQLWNGEKWTRMIGINRSSRKGDELEIVLRSGERISCTPTHKFPTERGLIEAGNLQVGDVFQRVTLPDNEISKDCAIDEDAAWFAGLYLAEGSHSDDCIQIAGHSKETERWERVCQIARKYSGSATRTISGNKMNIRISGKILNAIIDELVTGRVATDKGFSPAVWKYSNSFISSMLDGYLSGDGHWDESRWRLGFTRNYNLERDLRTACARLGYHIVLNLSTSNIKERIFPSFRGEIRMTRSGHRNEKNTAEIMEIRKSRCREVYDLGVEDDPHLFALASGILSHNSKSNPMPESVTDRCTTSHEYIFHFSKSPKYYYDQDAIREPYAEASLPRALRGLSEDNKWTGDAPASKSRTFSTPRPNGRKEFEDEHGGGGTGFKGHSGYYAADGSLLINPLGRNKWSVWTVPTKSYTEAHFATYPPDLIEPCILAGSRKGDIVLDPFSGSGTTGQVATAHGREYVGLELNYEYIKMSIRRLAKTQINLL